MFLRNAMRNQGDGRLLTLTDASQWLDKLSSPEERVNTDRSLEVSAIAAAHRILTNSVGNLPVKVFRKADGSRDTVKHILDYVLEVRANENMSPFMMKKLLMSQAFWYGDGFAYVSRDRYTNAVTELIPLPSETMQAYKDEKGYLWYAFSVDGAVRKFRNDDLLHVMFESVNGVTGKGILTIARDAISTERASQRYAGKFYTNGARVSGIISVESKIDQSAKDKARESFERMANGMDNAFRTAVLDMGMKYTPLGISQSDAQYVESRNFSVEEVSRFTGVPIYKFQSGKQSYQSNEQQGLDYVVGTLQPHVTQWEQEFKYKLLSTKDICDGYYLKFNMAAEMRGDNKSRSEYYQKMIQNGIYSIDDCLDLEDMNRLPDGSGQLHWITKNYDTIQNIIGGGVKDT